MKNLLAILFFFFLIILALYIAIWWGIVEPITTVAKAIDEGTVTASLVGWELIKFLLKEFLAAIVIWIGWFLGIASLKR